MEYLKLTQPDRTPGSYFRREYADDVLNRTYRFNEVRITFSRRATKIKDALAEELQAMGLITPAQKEGYLSAVSAEFTGKGLFYDHSMEGIYAHLHQRRKELLGAAPLEEWKRRKMQEKPALDFKKYMDQRSLGDQLLAKSEAVIFALLQPEFFGLLQEDLKKVKGRAYLLTAKEPGNLLPAPGTVQGVTELPADSGGIAYEEELQQAIHSGNACLFVYGEQGLLECRSLSLDSFVYGVPRGYHTQAVTNQLGQQRPCALYIPKQFNVTQWVRILEPTRLSYWHLYRVWQEEGEEIYALSPLELYQKYTAHFLNIYENEPAAPLPLQVSGFGTFTEFDAQKEEALRNYLESFKNIRYYSAHFKSEEDAGILVNAVKVKRSRDARVLSCEKNATLRKKFKELNLPETGLVSNFLFFMTQGLASLYNTLREDRPKEQADVSGGHLDYMLRYAGDKRIETFPLFRKTCIAMKEDGTFIFFNFRLGGGKATINGYELSWTREAVDTETEAPIRVYTPYLSVPDEEGDRSTYRKPVGENRLNLVVFQDQIVCIRKGDVILPSVGVVLSLDQQAGEMFLHALKLTPDEQGYYDPSGLEFSLKLDPPAGVDPADWEKVQWAYGGGLSLILDGVGLDEKEDLAQWFQEEGWMSPLSRQTQESGLHTMAKHPRTAIGTTREGELVILVFSGRTRRSSGADYLEMCAITRKLFPDIQCLMNVDGGGSAMLGLVHRGSFMELSLPSTSVGSSVGMVRPINTVFYIPAE